MNFQTSICSRHLGLSQLTDDEFRKLSAKRENEVRRTKVTLFNQIAYALILFSLLTVGAAHAVDRGHLWTPIEIWAIVLTLAVGILMHLGARRIAFSIQSED